MKILYVTTISNTINSFLIPHIRFLVEKGHKVDIACNIVERVSPELNKLGCKVHNIGFQRHPFKKANVLAYRNIRKIILSEDYELVHTHTPIASILTRISCRNARIKQLYTVHGFHFFKGAPIWNWAIYYLVERIAAKYTDGIITINEEDYQRAKKMILRKADSIFKVNGVGIDLNKFVPCYINEKSKLREKHGYKANDFILFYAAELNYNKHQDLLIKVVNLLKDKVPDIKLLLAGNGCLTEQYKTDIKKLGLEDNIVILGYRKDIPSLLKIADVAVASSRREGLPVNIIEAMATGLPLVVTDCRGHRDLVRDGYNGYLIKINDENSFADAILKFYQLEELRQTYSKRNIELVKLYSLKDIMKEISHVYSYYLGDQREDKKNDIFSTGTYRDKSKFRL